MSDHAEDSVDDEDYEVEGIVGHKDSRHGRKYEVKWKGYKDTTFEPRENLVPNSENLVVEYDKKHPLKKSVISTRSRSKNKHERKTRKSEINTSQSGDEATDSNIENEKPNVEAKRKRKLSERVKAKIKSRKKADKKTPARSRRVVKESLRSSRKKKGRKKSRMVILQSSSQSSLEEYEVDLLLKHRDLEDRRMYLVKWKGYPKAEATWEPSRNLSCRTLVRQYEHLRGKWKRPRKRAGDSSDKQPSKRMRTIDNSDHETKESEKKLARRRLMKRKDGTWSNEREDDNAEKDDAKEHANDDDKEKSNGDKKEKSGVLPKGEELDKVGRAETKLDKAGDEKNEEKGETKDEVDKTNIPDGEEGSQIEKEKTKDNSPKGEQEESSEGTKPAEEVRQK